MLVFSGLEFDAQGLQQNPKKGKTMQLQIFRKSIVYNIYFRMYLISMNCSQNPKYQYQTKQLSPPTQPSNKKVSPPLDLPPLTSFFWGQAGPRSFNPSAVFTSLGHMVSLLKTGWFTLTAFLAVRSPRHFLTGSEGTTRALSAGAVPSSSTGLCQRPPCGFPFNLALLVSTLRAGP